MTILIAHIIAFVICTVIIKVFDIDSIIGILCFILDLFIGASFFVFAMLFIGAHVEYFERATKVQLEEQYNAINYILDNDKMQGSDIIGQVSEYNSTILNKRYYNSISLLEPYTYDFYDDIPLIELEG